MKNAIKYICALLLLVGVNVSAWGAVINGTNYSISSDAINFGNLDASNSDYIAAGVIETYTTITITLTSAQNTYAYFVASPDDYYITGYSDASQLYVGNSIGAHTLKIYTYFPLENGTHTRTLYISIGSSYEEIEVTGTVINACTSHSISLTDAGSKTGGSFSTNVSSSCKDETITITATPDAGYRVDTWTVLDGNADDVELSGTGNTRTFAMPNSNTVVDVTFAAQTYDVTLKPNGGSGSDQVVRVTYGEIPPTTLKVGGGAVVIPTRTGYDFDGYYDNTSGGTQYYSYKGSPKALAAEELWDKPNDANLYARWIANTTTVTLDKGTGGTTDGTALIDYDATEYGDIDHAVNNTTGYHLDGYYTNDATPVKVLNADGSFAATNVTGYITDGKWSNTGDEVTLYAHWALNIYTISFDKNSGSGSMEDVEKVYGSTYALPACGFTAPSGKVFDGWAEGSALGTKRTLPYNHTVTADITFYALWRDATFTDYVFSCAALTLTEHLVTASTPIFITSVANKKVRSQDYITITGSGLTPNTPLTFPGLNSKFEVLTATGGTISTDASGAINENAYIFYTPAADATTDGLDKLTGITVSVGGAKPKTVVLTQDIIGRHLPADFVIAGKKDNKWYALPSNMASTTNPKPSEIAVDDFNNPSVAYTATSNIYGLEGPTTSGSGNNISTGNGQYIRLTMSIESSEGSGKPAPLFGTSGSEDASNSPKVGKSGTAIATNTLSEGWWWSLTQTNTSITNPQDAKYIVKCANNSNTLSIKNSPFVWGLYASGVEELRLIPASDIIYTEAYFVEWAKNGGVVEVNAKGVSAYKVKAKLDAAESSLITLSETQTSAGNSSKYNYTVNFGDGIDFSANEGEMLTLEWYDNSGTPVLKAVSNIMVPKIIATSTTMSSTESGDTPWSKWEVHVLPGVTLEANAGSFSSGDVTIKQLEIYPNATVKVTTGTLDVGTLIMHNGWTRAGTKKYDVARLYIQAPVPAEDITGANLTLTTAYMDWYIDYDQFYPIAVPWKVTLATGLQYRYTKVSPTYGYDKNIRLLYYDGEGRVKGTNGSAGDGANWRFYGAPGGKAMPATLDPSKAYAMTAKRPTGKAFSIIRMTMEVPSADWTTSGEQGHVTVGAVTTHKDTVNVVAYNNDQGNAAEYAKGWNFIANPYMSLYQGQIGYTEGEETVRFVNIPDEKFKEYDQLLTTAAKLKPASGVLIQAPETGRLIFGTAQRKLSMPSFYSEIQKEQMSEQQAVIVLSDETNEDMMGLLIADKFTEAYETNADLEKLLSDGNTLRTYMRYGDMNMAYVAINDTLAQEWIPVNVRIPADGEYTFSLHEASKVSELEGVYLIDYQNGDKITNLIEQSYTFSSTAGTINGRFSINAKAGERQTPTGIDAINAGGDINSDKPFKFIYHDKVYIWLNGIIYDTTGKRVK